MKKELVPESLFTLLLLCVLILMVFQFVMLKFPAGFLTVTASFQVGGMPTLTQNIPDQGWYEDEDNTNAFDLDDYFNDPDGDPMNFTVSGNTNIVVQISNVTHLVNFSQPVNWSGSENVVFTANDSTYTTNSNIVKLTVTEKADVYVNLNFGGCTTNFSNKTSNQLQNLSNMCLEVIVYGKMHFLENVNLSGDVNFDDNANFSFNRIFFNETNLSFLNNKNVQLYLYNLTFDNPRVLRNNEICPSVICTEKAYSGGTLRFNITQFSEYKAEETPVVIVTKGGGKEGGPRFVIKPKEAVKEVPEKEVVPEVKRYFDMDVKIPSDYKEVYQGKKVMAIITIINLAGAEKLTANINYFIQDLEGNVIVHDSEARIVETQISFFREFKIPTNAKPGDYIFLIEVEHDGTFGYAHDFFIVHRPLYVKEPYLVATYVLLGITFIVILFVIYNIVKILKKPKMKRKKFKK